MTTVGQIAFYQIKIPSEKYYDFMYNNYFKVYIICNTHSVGRLNKIIHFETLKIEHQNLCQTQFYTHTQTYVYLNIHIEVKLDCKIDFGMVLALWVS